MLNTLLQECGLYGGSDPTDITVDYTIHLAASVLFVTIHPSISGSASFACPLSVRATTMHIQREREGGEDGTLFSGS